MAQDNTSGSIPLQVLYFGELDPLSGSYPQEEQHLRRLVRELLFNLLFSDVVILPPGTFLEHALTLPAFEVLAPFVQHGILGTSVDPRQATDPQKVIAHRIDQALEAEPEHSAGALSAWRRRHLEEFDRRQRKLLLFDAGVRFADLLPQAWPIVRDTKAQVSSFADTLRAGLAQALAEGFQAAPVLDTTIQRLLDADIAIERYALLVKFAALRDRYQLAPTRCATRGRRAAPDRILVGRLG